MTTSTLYLEVTAAAAETAGKIIAQRKGANNRPVRVTVGTKGGATASVQVNGSHATMNLPTLPASTVLSRSEADRMLGFIAHECLHVLHTDWQWWSHCVAAGARTRHWANCLEDVRIEAKEIRAGHFPALRGILSATTDHVHYQGIGRAAKDGRAIGARIADAPYCVAILGRMANRYTVPTARGLRAALHPDVARLVDRALAEVTSCGSTYDVYNLAMRMVDLERQIIEANTPPPPPPPPPPRDDQDAPGEPTDDQDAPGADGDDQDDQDDQDAPGAAGDDQDDQDAPGAAGAAGDDQDDQDAPGADGDDQDDQDDQDAPGADGDDQDAPGADGDDQDDQDAPGDGHGDGNENPYSLDDAPEASETLAEVAEAIAERQTPDAPKPMGNGLHGYRNVTVNLPARLSSGDPLAHVQAYNTALPGRAVLHGQISRLLVSPERVSVTHRETSGRLDRRALARIGTGALDVFSRKQEAPGMDTALLVLIDLSSSMRGPAHEMACVTAFHLAAAAEDAGAKVAVYGFMDHDEPMDVATARLVPLLPFGMPVRANAHRLLAVRPHITTPLSPAILGCAEVLRTIDATRHVMMVLTDGDCDYGNACVTDACLVARSWGVEVVGLGMAAPQVAAAFPTGYSVNVPTLDALGQTGLGVLARMLEEAAPDLGA
jgi:Cobalamin biosynthesis protein CobT VWA domain